MNTIIWIMMAYTGHAWVPTLEFTTQEKCERATVVIKGAYDSRGWASGTMATPWCVKVEK